MIVDVSSELPDVELRAHDSRGGSYVLQPGRNFLPVTAYRTGALQIDFHGRAAPAASIQPAMLDYHLNKGGVAYGKVEVLSTFTVMGHLKDTAGNPLAGAHVINHAGRSVAEADGFFALEMSATTPTSKCATRRWPVAASRWTAPPPALRVTLAGRDPAVPAIRPHPGAVRCKRIGCWSNAMTISIHSTKVCLRLRRALCTLALLMGVGSAHASDILITAEFKPSVLNPDKREFVNTTPWSGCATARTCRPASTTIGGASTPGSVEPSTPSVRITTVRTGSMSACHRRGR